MHDSVDDGLSQSLQRLLWYINSLKTFNPGSHCNIAAQEQFRPIDQILECSGNKPAVCVSTGTKRLTIQNTGHVALHTPDFLVLRKDGASFEEWKPEEKLLELMMTHSGRYQRDERGKWRCPPGEAAAESLGLSYRVRSSEELHPGYIRNLIFLEEYFFDCEVPSLDSEMEETSPSQLTHCSIGTASDGPYSTWARRPQRFCRKRAR